MEKETTTDRSIPTDYVDVNYLGKVENYPTGYYLLIDPLTKDEYSKVEGGKTTKGGIFIPEAAKDFDRQQMQDWRGRVVAMGALAYKDFTEGQLWCKPGDEVLFARNAGKWIHDDLLGKSVVLLFDKDIIGIKGSIPPGWTKEQYEEQLRARDEQ